MNSRSRLLALLFFLSGAAGIGYQLVWTKMYTAGLGHEVPALLAVVSAYFAGLALGGWTFDRRIQHSANPAHFFGQLEMTVGGWGCLSLLVIPPANHWALRLIGVQPSGAWQAAISFGLPFVTLLPGTIAMGATLPAMERWLALFSPDGRCLGTVYALNTAGAMMGVLSSVFVFMPVLGLNGSICTLAGLNFLCGTLALLNQSRPATVPQKSLPNSEISQRRAYTTLFFTGLLGIGFEIVGIRLLSQVLEGTIYTFAVALAVYLLGTALGAALFQRFGRTAFAVPLLTLLLCLLAVASAAGAWFLTGAQILYDWARAGIGDGPWAVAASEMLVAASVFGLPTLCMGALFSHLTQAARRKQGGIGRALALNTLGATLAGPLFGILLLPNCGAKWTLVLASVGPLLCLPRLSFRVGLAFLPILALALVLPNQLHFLNLPRGGTLVEYREGAMSSVAVVATPDGQRALRVNNRFQMGGTAAALAERRQAHLPLLLHPAPKRALFLGPGTGITLGAASLHPHLQSEGVELLPEVLAVMHHFEPENEGPLPKAEVTLYAADARRFVRTTSGHYDVIVADLFHPAQDGAGFLYTREHFEAIRQRLRTDGLFCQWLPLHQMDERTLQIIIRTFTAVFSQTRAFLLQFNVDIPALGLVGTREPLALPADWLEQRLGGTELSQRMKSVGLDRTINLFGCLVAGPKALEQYAGVAPIATDNFPRVNFTAPAFAVRRDRQPHELLLQFLARCRGSPSDLLVDAGSNETRAFAANLSDFIAARDVYLHGLVKEGAGDLPAALDAYLESARRSLYFTPAYARCVGIVQMLSATDKAAARRLYERLEQAQPNQPLGKKMLGPLFEQP